MPWLPLLLDVHDAPSLVDWLSAQPELAFIVSDGPGRWKAVDRVESLPDGRHEIWHHAGAPLPLLRKGAPDEPIRDPFAGWTERRAGADPSTPYFGPGHPSTFRLSLWTRHRPYSDQERAELPVLSSRWLDREDRLSLSGFEWIGDRYGAAPKATHRAWRRMRGWVSRNTTALRATGTTFWAFPSALVKLRGGMRYDANGFDLSEALAQAE